MSEIQVADGVASVPREDWNALAADESPFLAWEFLASLEEAGCVGERSGWIPRPLLAHREGALVAACPAYVKLNSEGEFVYDWSWADAAYRAGIDYYPKLLVGVPFSPVSGTRFLVAEGEDRRHWEESFGAFLRDLCGPNALSGVHVNFCAQSEVESLLPLGYVQRTGFQYHWHNLGYECFEDYLGRFRSKRRNQIRRERRQLAEQGVVMDCVTGDDIDERTIDDVYRFYVSTVQSHYYGRQYLNRPFFDLLYEQFREHLVFTVARRGDRAIAGTFNVRKGDALYGRYWGADEAVRQLHFDACYYTPVEYCIAQGLARFEPGAGGDYKQVRGFDAQPTFSAHYLEDPRLANAIREFLARERTHVDETIDWLQDERSALKKADDLA